MTPITYFPGCSLHSTAREYRASAEETFRLLGFTLSELRDWNCCGATSAHTVDERLSIELPARNLALASATTDLMVVPCAACFSRQKNAEVLIAGNPVLKAQVEQALGRRFERAVSVQNILDFLRGHLELIRARVQSPLSGLRVACYYGCLLTRPPKITGEKRYEDPQAMDDIVRCLGAVPVQWSYKTECCGGSHSIARGDIVHELIRRLFVMAREAEAQAIITACPLCQTNLDARQKGAEEASGERFGIPALYITELISAALGSSRIGEFFSGHFVDPSGVLRGLAAI